MWQAGKKVHMGTSTILHDLSSSHQLHEKLLRTLSPTPHPQNRGANDCLTVSINENTKTTTSAWDTVAAR